MHHVKGRPLLVIFLTAFIDLLGFGILIPVIPLLLADPHSPYFLLPKGATIQTGYILLGFLTAMFPIGQFVATPILGQLSDKYGRKNLLALSLAGTCLSYVIFGIGIIIHNLPLLFVARFFDGLTGGNISIAQAAIADITTPQNRAKNFGLVGAAFGLGFILGPYLGGKLSDPSVMSWFDAATPFWFAAILSFANVMSVLLFFPETLKNPNPYARIDWSRSIHNIIKAYTLEQVRIPFFVNFLFQGGFTFFTTFFSVYLIQKFAFTQGNIGDFFAFIGLCSAVTQAFVTRKVAGKFKEYQILRISMFGVALGTFLYFFPIHAWQAFAIVPMFSLFTGLSQANMPGLISRSVGPEIQGEILGINSSIQALAQAIPPMLSGFIAASLSPESPIVVATAVLLTSAIIFALYYKPVQRSEAAGQIAH